MNSDDISGIDDSNPSMGVSPPGSGESDQFVITFYDTDDPDNTKEDPVIEEKYELSDDEVSEFEAEFDTELSFALLLMDRDELYEVLDEVKA